MSIFSIVFLDGEKVTVEAPGFSVAKVRAACKRVKEGAKRHVELTADDSKSSKATMETRGT